MSIYYEVKCPLCDKVFFNKVCCFTKERPKTKVCEDCLFKRKQEQELKENAEEMESIK